MNIFRLTLIIMSLTAVSSDINKALAQSVNANEVLVSSQNNNFSPTYALVDSNQSQCFGIEKQQACSQNNEALLGQDALYQGNKPSYTKHNNGTVSDNVTGLIWSQTSDINNDGEINVKDKLTYTEAIQYIKKLNLAGHNNWRLPSIKELYSLTLFDGQDPSGIRFKVGKSELIPFIDHSVFGISTGDTKAGERLIDSQFVSSTKYVSTTMNGDDTVFGVNFIDGRIKGYGTTMPDGSVKTFYVLAVSGNQAYGKNNFVENKDSTIADQATTLVWQQKDSVNTMNFVDALGYCENLMLAGKDDWRLPNVKELQSLVDYSKSPDTSNSAAIDSLFHSTEIMNENDVRDYGNYWSSTTHINLSNAANAAYISFGRSTGFMGGKWLDVHGAGSQRSAPKVGDASKFPQGKGPQGDSIRINNMVRCVRGGMVNFVENPQYQARAAMTIENANVEPVYSKAMNKSILIKMDKNKDGKISQGEAKGPLKANFNQLDKNADGYISQSEIPGRPEQH